MKVIIDVSETINVNVDIKKLLDDNYIDYAIEEEKDVNNKDKKGFEIEKEVCKLIDNIINDIKEDFLNSKNDLDSRLFGLEMLSNLQCVMAKNNLTEIMQIEYHYRNGDIYVLHEELQQML